MIPRSRTRAGRRAANRAEEPPASRVNSSIATPSSRVAIKQQLLVRLRTAAGVISTRTRRAQADLDRQQRQPTDETGP
jgi:hypothetical protein